jgi:hypothetical protein
MHCISNNNIHINNSNDSIPWDVSIDIGHSPATLLFHDILIFMNWYVIFNCICQWHLFYGIVPRLLSMTLFHSTFPLHVSITFGNVVILFDDDQIASLSEYLFICFCYVYIWILFISFAYISADLFIMCFRYLNTYPSENYIYTCMNIHMWQMCYIMKTYLLECLHTWIPIYQIFVCTYMNTYNYWSDALAAYLNTYLLADVSHIWRPAYQIHTQHHVFHAALLAASSVTGCMLCALFICFTQRYWLLAVLQAACYVHHAALLAASSVTGCMLCALFICFTQRYWLLAVLQAACYVHHAVLLAASSVTGCMLCALYVSRSVTGC